MPGKSAVDEFANFFAVTLDETAQGTATYGIINFPYSIKDKIGLVISRIDYLWRSLDKLNSSMDYATAGLCVSNNLADASDYRDPAIIDAFQVRRIDLGTAASGFFRDVPYTKDYSTLPGGGLLVAPNPLYAFVVDNGASAAMGISLRAYYTWRELSADEYWELVESRRVITN